MGQYYKVVKINDENDFEKMEVFELSSLKLMEHSWVGNPDCGKVMNLMTPGNPWHKSQVVWVGDYYNEDGEIDYYDKVEHTSIEVMVDKSLSEEQQQKCYLINYSKKQYVDYSKMTKNEDGWMINPLPLLTALGNGRGGGDYYDGNPDYDKVGIWAQDILAIDFEIPDGFEEFIVRFEEE